MGSKHTQWYPCVSPGNFWKQLFLEVMVGGGEGPVLVYFYTIFTFLQCLL